MEKKNIENFILKLSKELKINILPILILNLIKAEKGPMYGYEVIKSLKAISDERLEFQAGEVYAVLRMLETRSLLKSYWESTSDGSPRKYYTLTDTGKEAVEGANVQWFEISAIVKDVLEKLKVIKK